MMIKKLLLGGVVSAAMLAQVFAAEAKQPQLTPEQQQQLMQLLAQRQQQITVADAVKELPDDLAVINGKNFTKKDLVAALNKQFANGKMPPGFTAALMKQYAPQIVTDMAKEQLLTEQVQKAGITPSAEMVKNMMEKQLKSASKEELGYLSQMLAQQKKTMDQFINEQSANPMVQKQVALQSFLEKNVLAGVKVTDAEAEKFYNQNKARFVEPQVDDSSWKAAQVKAESILAQLKKAPEKFAELAKADSSCPSKEKGGSLGSFGKGQMVKEFETAAFNLKPGQISGLVKTQFGYHIIRRDAAEKGDKADTIRASHILIAPQPKEVSLPFAKVKEQLIQMLTIQKQQQAVQDYANGLLKKANFKLLIQPAAPQAPAAK